MYVFKDFFNDPTIGIGIYHGSKKKWKGTLIGSITGDENSLAREMHDFINTESLNYRYKNIYKVYPGPNSNTYIQWILNKFPESKITLPWNCFGKNYK